MKFKLPIRKITESDISIQRPFMPENENYEMYLSALIEDIRDLNFVTEVTQQGDYLVMDIGTESDFKLLHSAIKKIYTNQYFDKLLVSSGFERVL